MSMPGVPLEVRQRLRDRMQAHKYDDLVVITRDRITGRHEYEDLRSMRFAARRMCAQVDRSAWPAALEHRGLVYCEADHCLIVPTVCGNVAQVTRKPQGGIAGGGGLTLPLAAPVAFEHATPIVWPELPATQDAAPKGPDRAVGPSHTEVDGDSWASHARPWGAPPSWNPYGPALVVGNWTGYRAPHPAPPVPEPGTWAMLCAGLAVCLWRAARGKAL